MSHRIGFSLSLSLLFVVFLSGCGMNRNNLANDANSKINLIDEPSSIRDSSAEEWPSESGEVDTAGRGEFQAEGRTRKLQQWAEEQPASTALSRTDLDQETSDPFSESEPELGESQDEIPDLDSAPARRQSQASFDSGENLFE